MATLDLWLEGDWGNESVVWNQELNIDLDRFHYDQYYCERVCDHIKRAMHYLAKEIEEIGVVSGRDVHRL